MTGSFWRARPRTGTRQGWVARGLLRASRNIEIRSRLDPERRDVGIAGVGRTGDGRRRAPRGGRRSSVPEHRHLRADQDGPGAAGRRPDRAHPRLPHRGYPVARVRAGRDPRLRHLPGGRQYPLHLHGPDPGRWGAGPLHPHLAGGRVRRCRLRAHGEPHPVLQGADRLEPGPGRLGPDPQGRHRLRVSRGPGRPAVDVGRPDERPGPPWQWRAPQPQQQPRPHADHRAQWPVGGAHDRCQSPDHAGPGQHRPHGDLQLRCRRPAGDRHRRRRRGHELHLRRLEPDDHHHRSAHHHLPDQRVRPDRQGDPPDPARRHPLPVCLHAGDRRRGDADGCHRPAGIRAAGDLRRDPGPRDRHAGAGDGRAADHDLRVAGEHQPAAGHDGRPRAAHHLQLRPPGQPDEPDAPGRHGGRGDDHAHLRAHVQPGHGHKRSPEPHHHPGPGQPRQPDQRHPGPQPADDPELQSRRPATHHHRPRGAPPSLRTISAISRA